MISVAEALSRCFDLAPRMPDETVDLDRADGRVLASDVTASRDQPPFASSAMDGYAIRSEDRRPGARLSVIGESAAGNRFEGSLGEGQAVRIFTGAPVPRGADLVVIQEDVHRDADTIELGESLDEPAYIRPAGSDFRAGEVTLNAPRRLTPDAVALLAAMNRPQVPVARSPVVALISTGDELVQPGDTPGPDQICASNNYALAAIARSEGAEARLLPIARDNEASLRMAFELAEGADLIVTSGGASVGDHDLVGPVARQLGMKQSFYKVAMRPGKPLMAGRFGDAMLLGLPGNPVSAIVCGHVFMRPILRAMQGLPAEPLPRRTDRLAVALGANGAREHYLRARLDEDGIYPASSQDSSLLSVLVDADVLVVRPPGDPARAIGDPVEYIAL